MRDERTFWTYWLSGLLLLVTMAVMNIFLSLPSSPLGIIDHQTAGTGARVDDIQFGWKAGGVLTLARISIALDLVFIAVYSRGAYLGGRVMRQETSPMLRRLGTLVMIAAALYPILDYTETLSQFAQVISFKGSDVLAGIAATVRPFKSVDFLVTLIGLLTALALRQVARRKA
jgi:1,4-dihydroxy-2-naphthoate octaprenyltransferase